MRLADAACFGSPLGVDWASGRSLTPAWRRWQSRAVRWLALDCGSRSIGLAVGDDASGVAVPLRTIERRGGAHDVERLLAVCAEVEAEGLVLGLPLELSGAEGPAARRVRQLGERVAARFAGAVCYWDERFTTVEAERLLITAEVRRQRRRKVIDHVAAALILQGFLGGRDAAASPQPKDPARSSTPRSSS
ncbi:MAG: Holliday junction resolvase RuvX [Proteobacteria bacterium]|nr:Holliday junction resolvase RuvX [Pseudomonadota bacterium]